MGNRQRPWYPGPAALRAGSGDVDDECSPHLAAVFECFDLNDEKDTDLVYTGMDFKKIRAHRQQITIESRSRHHFKYGSKRSSKGQNVSTQRQGT